MAAILIVKRDRNARQKLVRHFQALNLLTIHSCESMSSALGLIAKHKFDIIISGYNLPDGNGHKLYQAVRQREASKATQFVFFTPFPSIANTVSKLRGRDKQVFYINANTEGAGRISSLLHPVPAVTA